MRQVVGERGVGNTDPGGDHAAPMVPDPVRKTVDFSCAHTILLNSTGRRRPDISLEELVDVEFPQSRARVAGSSLPAQS
ncbi:hypothetical protein [Rhizobium leguminosarum]|uniref:hypothetical protein n=1 Tax=Rhizobium leguminosarum TaxID=384 RepID=UPI0013DF3C9B|nr:hypothetical protein [Rhizobium leguminosarum]MBY5435197.1 hypothetical protein [Rhizobium leguminosarum]